MSYPDIRKLRNLLGRIELQAQLHHEYGARGLSRIVAKAERDLKATLSQIRRAPCDPALRRQEPDDLDAIRALRPRGPRCLCAEVPADYAERVEGALLGRMAGCTLGAIVEGWEIVAMERWARTIGDPFPPTDYWTKARDPERVRYGMSTCAEYTRDEMDGVPVDDDVVYTLLGLLILEDYGPDFTTEDVGAAWLEYLPLACTAEEIALENLRAGVPADRAAEKNNPYVQWIGADIRADPWGYVAPGRPERAAEMAWRDARLSHRRNGIYGEMLFAAAIAAAFVVGDPVEALRIGLTEIPRNCRLARDARWALKVGAYVNDYREARQAVDARFKGMHKVHTNNNACLTIFGLMIGGLDFTAVISETVAMGLDNDCTAATAGSIAGAILGRTGIPEQWPRNFNDTVRSYLNRRPRFKISTLVRRFTKQARRVR